MRNGECGTYRKSERGTRNAEHRVERRIATDLPLLFRVPRSAFRVPSVG